MRGMEGMDPDVASLIRATAACGIDLAPNSAHSRVSGNPEQQFAAPCGGPFGPCFRRDELEKYNSGRSFTSWPDLLPQVGFTRFAALNNADVGQARRPF